jgi:hypothetical protein
MGDLHSTSATRSRFFVVSAQLSEHAAKDTWSPKSDITTR